MNILSRFLLLPALACALLTAPLVRGEDPAALARFKDELLEIKKYSETESKKVTPGSPAAGIAVVRGLTKRLQAVSTAGIPDDLKTPFSQFVAGMQEMTAVFEGWPETDAEFLPFVQKKAADDPTFASGLGTKVAAIEKKTKPAAAELDRVGKKYGLEDLSALSGPKPK